MELTRLKSGGVQIPTSTPFIPCGVSDYYKLQGVMLLS